MPEQDVLPGRRGIWYSPHIFFEPSESARRTISVALAICAEDPRLSNLPSSAAWPAAQPGIHLTDPGAAVPGTIGTLRAWRNGRRAVFRCPCSKERGGSSPSARTHTVSRVVDPKGAPAELARAFLARSTFLRNLNVGTGDAARLPV